MTFVTIKTCYFALLYMCCGYRHQGGCAGDNINAKPQQPLLYGNVMKIIPISANVRVVENEECVDVEERVNGIWAVTRCSAVLSVGLPRQNFTTVVQKVKAVITKIKPTKIKREPRQFKVNEDHREKAKLIYYGLSKEEYENMKLKQKNTCLICKKKQPLHINKGELYIDHCHNTGRVRGLLCSSCNSGLGFFRDNITYLNEAIKYLKRKS